MMMKACSSLARNPPPIRAPATTNQRARPLVERGEVGGVQRAEEERGPALGTRQDGGGVIRVGPARGREVPQVQQPGYAKQADQGRPRPGWILGLAAHEREDRVPQPWRRRRRSIRRKR